LFHSGWRRPLGGIVADNERTGLNVRKGLMGNAKGKWGDGRRSAAWGVAPLGDGWSVVDDGRRMARRAADRLLNAAAWR
jgi:hypothetical protein